MKWNSNNMGKNQTILDESTIQNYEGNAKRFCVIDDIVLHQGYIPKKKFTFADVENIENEPSNKLDSPSKY